MKTILSTTAAVVLAAAIATPAAANTANSAYNRVQAEWAKMDKTGGHGNPLVEIPAAIFGAFGDVVDAMTADEQVAEQPETPRDN